MLPNWHLQAPEAKIESASVSNFPDIVVFVAPLCRSSFSFGAVICTMGLSSLSNRMFFFLISVQMQSVSPFFFTIVIKSGLVLSSTLML